MSKESDGWDNNHILSLNGELRVGGVFLATGRDFARHNCLMHIMKALFRRRRCISPFMVMIGDGGEDYFLLEHRDKLTIINMSEKASVCYVGVIPMDLFEKRFVHDLRRYCANGGVSDVLDVKSRKRETRRLGRLLEEYDALMLPWGRKSRRRVKKPKWFCRENAKTRDKNSGRHSEQPRLQLPILKEFLRTAQESSSFSEFKIRSDVKALKGMATILEHYGCESDFQEFKLKTRHDLDFLEMFEKSGVVNVYPADGGRGWGCAPMGGSSSVIPLSYDEVQSTMDWLGIKERRKGGMYGKRKSS